jgi:hypothetical protein
LGLTDDASTSVVAVADRLRRLSLLRDLPPGTDTDDTLEAFMSFWSRSRARDRDGLRSHAFIRPNSLARSRHMDCGAHILSIDRGDDSERLDGAHLEGFGDARVLAQELLQLVLDRIKPCRP